MSTTWTDRLHVEPSSWSTRVVMNDVRGPDLVRMVEATPLPEGHVDAITGPELFSAAGHPPYDFQMRFMGYGSTKRFRAADVSRQGGKTTTQAAGALETVSMYRRCEVGVLTPSMDQSRLILKDVRQFYLDHHNLFGRRIPRLVNPDSESPSVLIFSNGSQISALSAAAGTKKTGAGSRNRGHRLKRMIVDEAAFVDWDAITALFPALAATNGDLLASSTMWTDFGWWWEVVTGVGERAALFDVIRINADQLPHITQEHKDAARLFLGPEIYMREYFSVPPPRRGSLIPDDAILSLTGADKPAVEEWAPSWL